MNAHQKIVAPAAETSRIVDGINALTYPELSRSAGWAKIDALSPHIAFDAIDADPSSVVVDRSGAFEAQAYIYLMVSEPSTGERMGEEYSATVTGSISAEQVRINKVEVDTSTLDS